MINFRAAILPLNGIFNLFPLASDFKAVRFERGQRDSCYVEAPLLEARGENEIASPYTTGYSKTSMENQNPLCVI
jgi:hypothetical protein